MKTADDGVADPSRSQMPMSVADEIRQAMEHVGELRRAQFADADLATAIAKIKALQRRRFASSYADLLGAGPFQPAARFFLNDLYGETDYRERDEQFGRIAGPLQRMFPASVTSTALDLARLHVLTEKLDHAMALAWVPLANYCAAAPIPEARRYARAWHQVDQGEQRRQQVQLVLRIGRDLESLTRRPGLRTMLKMMRGPAQLAGMASLQLFLEAGFDTFAGLARQDHGVARFLALIEARESNFIDAMSGPLEHCPYHLFDGQA